MHRIAGITLGLVILAAPTSAAYASESAFVKAKPGYAQAASVPETFYGTGLVSSFVPAIVPSVADPVIEPAAEAPQMIGDAFVFTAWTMSGVVALASLFFVPGVVTRSKVRRRSTKEMQDSASKLEETFDCTYADLEKNYVKLVERLHQEIGKYGEVSLAPATDRTNETRAAIDTFVALRESLPAKSRTLEESENRLASVEAASEAASHAHEILNEAFSCMDYVIACEKAYGDEAMKIESQIVDMNVLNARMNEKYVEMEKCFDTDYIAGAKSEIELMKNHIAEAEKSLDNLCGWLAKHNLEMARKSAKHATHNIENSMSSYRAFNSRVMAISSFDLSRDAAVTGVTAELDSNISENRAEGMARIIGDARIAVKNARRLDTKSGNPAKSLEEIMVPVYTYRNTIADLKRKRASTESMKQTVFSAMDEAKDNHKALMADLQRYSLIPTPEERSALERIDAVLIHNFAKIRFDASSLGLFDVDKTAAWSGNALKMIMSATSHAASLKARVKAAQAAEKAKKDEEEKRRKQKKAEEDKRRRDEEDKRRKRRREESRRSSSMSSSSYSFSGD